MKIQVKKDRDVPKTEETEEAEETGETEDRQKIDRR